MILRVFCARLRSGKRDAYIRLIREESVPLMRASPGFVTLRVSAADPVHPDDFVLVSGWSDLIALKAFTGEQWNEVMVLPGEAALIEEMGVRHYDELRRPLSTLWTVAAEAAQARELEVAHGPHLTDAQWLHIQPFLPGAKRTGRPRADDRRTLEGILYVLRTSCRWQDLPREYGSPVTCWRRLTQWEADGTWDHVWRTYLETLTPGQRLLWPRTKVECRIATSPHRTRLLGA